MQLDGAEAAPAASRRRRFAPLLDRDWMFALALALAVGVLVWFGRSIKEFFAPTAATVFVPAFAGQTNQDARAECGRLRLRCVVIATQPSDRYPKDVVMNQQPGSGARVREGRQISLVVSSGVVIFPMPDLRFESLPTHVLVGVPKRPLHLRTRGMTMRRCLVHLGQYLHHLHRNRFGDS